MEKHLGAAVTPQNQVFYRRRKKVCVKGESNPQLNLGRVPCYHYTINAVIGK